MNLPDLIKWHERQLARLERAGWTEGDVTSRREPDALVAAHFDAIKLLKWCVELPAIDPSPFSRNMAFERLLEESAHLAGEPADDDEGNTDRMFWKRLNANVAEQMDDLTTRDPA